MQSTGIELTIRHVNSAPSTLHGLVDLRFTPPDNIVSREVAVNVPAGFDIEELRQALLDAYDYGQRLTRMLFADATLRREWEKTYAFTQGLSTEQPIALRLRLRLDLPFHVLHWETLLNPLTNDFLCFSERILLSRYYDSADLSPLRLVDKPGLKALVAVSSPTDLERYGLSAIDAVSVSDRFQRALGGIPSEVMSKGVSLNAIIGKLRTGYNVLCLVCHGVYIDGDTRLWLQHDDTARQPGAGDVVSGEEFVHRIQNLPRSPLLLVLASCQTGSFESEVSGVSLGPRLAAAGVPAVIAMQGKVMMATIDRIMPDFFQELLLTGVVDHSLAVARANLRDRMDWWMPVLFMRRWDGRLWNTVDALHGQSAPEATRSRSDRLRELRQLHQEGLITDQEYDTKRASILSEL
jgi:hypothetical protein